MCKQDNFKYNDVLTKAQHAANLKKLWNTIFLHQLLHVGTREKYLRLHEYWAIVFQIKALFSWDTSPLFYTLHYLRLVKLNFDSVKKNKSILWLLLLFEIFWFIKKVFSWKYSKHSLSSYFVFQILFFLHKSFLLFLIIFTSTIHCNA